LAERRLIGTDLGEGNDKDRLVQAASCFFDDAKFQRVADITGATVELVQACFARAMIVASKNRRNRGSIEDIDLGEFAWWFRKPLDLIQSIFDCFERVTRMVKDGRLAHWAERQGGGFRSIDSHQTTQGCHARTFHVPRANRPEILDRRNRWD
jgi:hypothetical protein